MKTIALNKGLVTLVDDEDFDNLIQYHWGAWKSSGGKFYARTEIKNRGHEITVLMHRLIMSAPPGFHIDHANGQTLDNRKQNLRVCTSYLNVANSKKSSTNTSGFKGVARNHKMWQAYIGSSKDGTWEFIGNFRTREEAAVAYDRAALCRWGEFALTNSKMGLL